MSALFRYIKPFLGVLLLLFVFSTPFVAVTTLVTPDVVYAQDPPDPGGEDPEGQLDDESCESNGGEFSFFICPFLRLANRGVEFFDSEVRERVQVDPAFYADDSGLRDVWARLRNIAFILLIPIVLIMVIGTALGFGFVDAYTVKRAMPRLLFAVIFMTLSYDIGAILIDISNAASRGIQGILVTAVADANELNLDALFSPPSSTAVDEGVTLLGTGFLATVAVSVGALSIGILASFLGSAALALLIIFFILLARQLIIVGILTILPLAILSWIFPGNDKLWKLSWGTFTALLWAGPAFAGFVILGRIMAYVVNQATGGVEVGGIEAAMLVGVKLGLIIMSLVGGLLVLRTLAGAAGNLFGIVNDRSRGLFDRNRQWRAKERERLGKKADNNERFSGNSKLSQWGNSIGRQARYAPTAMKEGGWKNISRYHGNQRANLENIQKQRIEEASQDKEFSVLLDWDNAAAALAEMMALNINDRKGMREFIDNDKERFGTMSAADKNTLVSQMQGFKEKYGGDERVVGMAAIKAAAVGGATDYTDTEGIGRFMALGAKFTGDSGALKANYDAQIASWLTAGGRAADMGGGSYSDRAGRSGEAKSMIDAHSMETLFGQEATQISKLKKVISNPESTQDQVTEAQRELAQIRSKDPTKFAAIEEASAKLKNLGGGVTTDSILHQDPRLVADSKTKPYAMDNYMNQAAHLVENIDQMISEQKSIAAAAPEGSAERRNAEAEIGKLEMSLRGVTSAVGKMDTLNKLYANANIQTSIDEGLKRRPVESAPAPGVEGPVAYGDSLGERARDTQEEMYRYRTDPRLTDEQQRQAAERAAEEQQKKQQQ